MALYSSLEFFCDSKNVLQFLSNLIRFLKVLFALSMRRQMSVPTVADLRGIRTSKNCHIFCILVIKNPEFLNILYWIIK